MGRKESNDRLQQALHRLLDVRKIRSGPVEIAWRACPIEHTLTVLGGAQVRSLDPQQLTSDEWQRLLDDWEARAIESMQLYCDRAGGEDCRRVVPILVSADVRFSGRAGVNGTPPHLLFIEMDIQFRCEQGPI
jgi:hypothetical protein